MMHVIPVNDLRPHTESSYCFCRPKLDKTKRVFVHSAADGREFLERAIYAETPRESMKHYAAYQECIWTTLPPKTARKLNEAAFARLFAAWQANEFEVIVDNPNKDA